MSIILPLICIVIIAITAYFIYKKYNPQGVLIFSGITMITIATCLGVNDLEITNSTGNTFFDIIKVINDKFISNLSRAGLMIMIIGGYVAFMNKIKATDTLVYISAKPLAFFKKYPYIAATITIPIGQALFITTPSAAGIGLLLVASVYPILVNLGVSKLTALSVIAAATIFDQGPGSANTALAAQLVGLSPIEYFLEHQMPIILPTTLFIMIIFYFNNRYFDKKDAAAGKENLYAENVDEAKRPDVPTFFALLPLLPIAILIIFSEYVGIFNLKISTSVAMLASLFVSFVVVLIYNRSLVKAFEMLGSFWKGMGSVFASVVTLIVSAEIFSGGLIQLGFIDSLIYGSTHIGLNGMVISVFITILVFLAAMLMGSGNAAFFSFGPLMPNIAKNLSIPAVDTILPMQLASSMGRAASPIAGVIVAIAGVAGVSPIELAKRNTIPLILGVIFLIITHLIF